MKIILNAFICLFTAFAVAAPPEYFAEVRKEAESMGLPIAKIEESASFRSPYLGSHRFKVSFTDANNEMMEMFFHTHLSAGIIIVEQH